RCRYPGIRLQSAGRATPATPMWATSPTKRREVVHVGRRGQAELPGNSEMRQRNRLSRRQMLGLSAGALLSAGLWPGALRAEGGSSPSDFHFVAVNDLHY